MDPFRILGVDTSADTGQIRAAYRRRARASHPDRGGDATAFAQVHEAYRQALALRRARHTAPPPPSGQPPPPPQPGAATQPRNRRPPTARRQVTFLARAAATDPAITLSALLALLVQVVLLALVALSGSNAPAVPVAASLATGAVAGAALFVALRILVACMRGY